MPICSSRTPEPRRSRGSTFAPATLSSSARPRSRTWASTWAEGGSSTPPPTSRPPCGRTLWTIPTGAPSTAGPGGLGEGTPGPPGPVHAVRALASLSQPSFSLQSPLQLPSGDASPVGTGASRLGTARPGLLELLASTDYWGGAPRLKRLTFRRLADEVALAAALLAGEVHVTSA